MHPIRHQDRSQALTVIVPTYNRSHFLRRLLAYAVEVDFPFRILVADSSGDVHAARNRAAIAGCQDRLRVEWRRHECGLMEKLLAAVLEVETDCCCFWADDDFQLPSGLQACIDFLGQDPSYGSCMGQFVCLRHGEPGGGYLVETYPARDEDSAGERVMRWSENFYSNFYAVYRTPILAGMLEAAVAASCYERCRIIPEVLMGQMSLLLGRQQMLRTPSIVYQMHPENDSRVTPCVRDHKAFPEDYRRYLEAMMPIVTRNTGLSAADAGRLVDRSFRNVYHWTGGRLWWLKKAVENLRRPWRRLQLRFDARRKNPRFTRVIKEWVPQRDPRLGSPELEAALRSIADHPAGLKDS